jgi:hypothetical protein
VGFLSEFSNLGVLLSGILSAGILSYARFVGKPVSMDGFSGGHSYRILSSGSCKWPSPSGTQ